MKKSDFQALEKAGFYSEEFRASMIKLRKRMSLDEIEKIHRLANDLHDCGLDPVGILRGEVARLNG